ncbi:MAG: pilus assembly protein CpaE [Myxococcota bacterium]|jgi:pilus assembly protein CpaE
MRMMVAGMSETSARRLQEMAGTLIEPDRVVASLSRAEPDIAADTPDILAVYLGRSPSKRLAGIRRLLALYPALQVIALVDADTPELVKMISVAGCVDMVLLPDCPADLQRALRALQERDVTDAVDGEAFALLGAKGGVGTTTIACNLADAIVTRSPDKRVALVDLNFYMGDVALLLDITPKPTTLTFLSRSAQADARTWTESPPLHRRNFRVFGLDGDLESADPVTAEQVVFLIERLRVWYDFVILDCGSDISEASLAACTTADRRLLVTTEELSSRLGARRRIQALRMLDPQRRSTQAIINRCHDASPEQLQRMEQSVGVTVAATLSNAWREVTTALERGRTLIEDAPRAEITTDFGRLAESLIGIDHQEDRRKKAFFDFFR